MENCPKVSVVIITYNSSQFICDTLDSIKNQTYHNLELIVSDDCSTDDTVDKVQSWLNDNKGRFVETKLVTTPKNTGVASNFNRGCDACSGDWIKTLAGDDMLISTCIEDNIRFVEKNTEANIVISNSIMFFNNGKKDQIQKPWAEPSFFEMSGVEQFEQLVHHDILLNLNSIFVSSKVKSLIKYDERIKFMEDLPFVWNCTKQGFKIYYLDKETVRYRKYDGALTGVLGSRLLSLPYHDSLSSFYYLMRKPELEKRNMDVSQYEKRILWYLFVKYILKNKCNLFTKALRWYFHKTIY